MLELKVIPTTMPQGFRILHKNKNNRWQRYTGRHFGSLEEVSAFLNKNVSPKHDRYTVIYPHGGVSHMGAGWVI